MDAVAEEGELVDILRHVFAGGRDCTTALIEVSLVVVSLLSGDRLPPSQRSGL